MKNYIILILVKPFIFCKLRGLQLSIRLQLVKMGQYFSAKCASSARLDGKTAIITGANTGIGKCTAQDFYLRGARVIIACRSLKKAEAAISEIIETCKWTPNLGCLIAIELDLTSLKSVRKCANEILNKEEYIHILVNNAGVMACPEGKTEDGFEIQIGTNHFGHFLFTLLLLPVMITSAPARIVNVSSIAHGFVSGRINIDDINWEKRTYITRFAYYESKLANVLFSKELARRLEAAEITGVTTYSLHPGFIATDLPRHLDTAVTPGIKWFWINIIFNFIKTPEQGAQTSIYCAVDEDAGNETGLYYAECKVTKPKNKANNVEDARRLWEVSCKLVGLENYNPFPQ